MRLKISLIIIIIIIVLNILTVGWDFKLNADSFKAKVNSNSTSISNVHPRDGTFDWGEIEVISEPITWQNNNINFSGAPKIAVEDDKIYMVWIDKTDYNNAGEDYDLFYRYYNGSNWSDIQVISEPMVNQNLNTGYTYNPNIAVENGKIYITWSDNASINNAGLDYDIFFRSNLTGTSWEDIQVISEPNLFGNNDNKNQSINPSIAVDNGKIYVVWEDYSDTNNAGIDGDIFYRCNLTGFSWEPIQIISEPLLYQNLNNRASIVPDIVAENGNIYVVWTDSTNEENSGLDEDIYYRCNLTGTNWEDVQIISEPIQGENLNRGNSRFPDIAFENNKIYVVWYDDNDTNSAGTDWDIFYRCNLTGNSWEHIQVISESIPSVNSNTAESMNPDITIENGKIYVVWNDNNNTDCSGSDEDIFYRCNITGANWEDIQVISEPVARKNLNTGISIYPDIAVNFDKNHIVWYDTNNTNGAGIDTDIFYRTITPTLVLGLPNVIPISGNTTTNFVFRVSYFHLFNITPVEITVNISGMKHSMLEANFTDTNYIDGKDYYFDIKNLGIGLHTYQFYAYDGFNKVITKLFNNPVVYNTPPNIITKNNLTVFEDIHYEIKYEYYDIDTKNMGQPIYWNFSTNASWLEFESTKAILNGTPTNNDVGKYWVNISINDTMDSDFTNFTLTVVNVNDAPVIITDDLKVIKEDEYYEKYYMAIDLDSPQESLFWNMQTNASGLDFEYTTTKLSGIPENDDVGEYWINISVTDTEFEDFSNFTLKVINVNDPPRIITKDNITAFEDDFYEVIYQAEDVDNTQNELFWDINTNAKWLNYDIPTAVINGTPTNDDIGEYWINISVSDSEFIDFTNFTLIVLNTNDPPMIITEDKTNATAGELYSINYEAEDIDPPPISLTWSINTNTSDWLTIDKYNGWLNGIPSVSDVGIYWVNVTVTDGESGWDFHNFTLRVLKLPIKENIAPKLTNAIMAPSEGNIETSFTFLIHYFDADGDAPKSIQIIIDEIPRNLKLRTGENTSNGIYYYNTTLTEGTHTYYFTASDHQKTVRTEDFTTSEIKKLEEASKEEASWLWLIWVMIVIVIIIIMMSIYLFKKRKAAKIPVVKAELMKVVPKHMALPGELSGGEMAESLASQKIISEQLPAPVPIETQYQLPKATLSKAQRLELLEERFLRGEVDLETYKELKAKIESHTGEDITWDELEEQPTINEPQQPENVRQPEIQESTEVQHELQPQTPQPQPSAQAQEPEKPIVKEQSEER